MARVFGFVVVRLTPPQARQVKGRKTKLRRDLLKLVDPYGFCEYIDLLKIRVDMLKVDIPRKDTQSNKMVVQLNVLCLSMEDWIPS